MIQYALRCADGHTFDSWFQSADAYERLASAGMVVCAICGGGGVEKAMMTPRVAASREPAPPAKLREPASPAEQALAELRRKIEENSEYVGARFVSEARAMHAGDAPERAIYGEARLDEARKLAEEGVPVAPLPFLPNRKAN
ncbi:DUF1178 family protein [Seohaeicola zhoushanensis]|uniref:DUF1178 family protein n=1 Tax=Seohaeicola zhoushanensis TaxID=1569283 RepID=A0A8J3M9H0_9RHOB|nr:DUF1178 family protein [Seohaeicola zhoushanensis]GHF49000.1 hypothetical protein GCM10017056_20700 [Seohaeicola zhoushanensis]